MYDCALLKTSLTVVNFPIHVITVRPHLHMKIVQQAQSVEMTYVSSLGANPSLLLEFKASETPWAEARESPQCPDASEP